uniref:Transmembrane protein 245 n=1 Tax=Heterorhabditis bacteriophora TaxID=37862 RepID=A0A1I7XRY3_HETBA
MRSQRTHLLTAFYREVEDIASLKQTGDRDEASKTGSERNMANGGSEALMNRLTSNHEQRTALQFAFFNTLLFTLLGVCFCGLFALYNMLYMFLSPMMWAVLVGTVLFPFKKKVTDVMQEWLADLQKTNTTLIVGIIMLPISGFLSFSEYIYIIAMSQKGVVLGATFILLKMLSYNGTFIYIISWLGRIYKALDSFILFFARAWVLPLIIIYFCAYATWIYVQESGTINKKLARTLSLPIWTYLLSFLSLYFGPFRAAIFGLTATVLALISAGIGVKDDCKVESTAVPINEQRQSTDIHVNSLDGAVGSDGLIRFIFGLCALLWVVRHDSALLLLVVPFLFAALRRIGIYIYAFSPLIYFLYGARFSNCMMLLKVLFTSDKMLISSLHSKMDILSSLVVHIVRLTSNVISSRPDFLATVMSYTEDQLEDHDIDIDNYVEQVKLSSFLTYIIENFYLNCAGKFFLDLETTSFSRTDWLTQLKSVTDLHALREEITLIIKENIDTLVGVASSIWAIVAVNLAFASSLVAAFAGLILGFGMDILNLLIEMIVFLTMVYYLLSASRRRWLPLEWASGLTEATTSANGAYEIAGAIEHAIFGVFVLSSKMAVFYALYTYFIHSLFDLNVVFVPSMLASLFAAVPIMPPYIVCIFGVFELWLVRGENAAAFIFAIMSFAPQMFADTTFYREIKSSHPYVTGLAIIGGIYWLGLQGAIIGPIILCSFLVLVNVFMQFVRPNADQRTSSEKLE